MLDIGGSPESSIWVVTSCDLFAAVGNSMYRLVGSLLTDGRWPMVDGGRQ